MTLARPDFIERDPTVIEPEVTAAFEAALGKQLFPGQLERLLLNVATYRELLVRIGIQYAAEQNLVNYAAGLNLDQLGALLTVTRLAASAATVTMQFSRGGTTGALLIPVGSTVRQPGSPIIFATDENATISSGQTSVTVQATATTTGANTSGFVVGTITQGINVPTGLSAISNTTISGGGADIEADEPFRTRIKLAPNQFSVAGSKGAYKFHALSVDPSIIDVAVLGPEDRNGADPVTVDVYPLLSTGLPSQAILDAVDAALNLDTIRPLTDIVNVQAPAEAGYSIAADVTLYTTADQPTVETALNAAAQAYADNLAAGLGRDIVRSQVIEALQSVEGVYSVSLSTPAADIAVEPSEWANASAITITIVGTNAG
ncbi:MAG: baseplate J/gp47 family protein [Cyanobacteria bacterium J06635_1]